MVKRNQPPKPAFDARGDKLWADMTADGDLSPVELTLLEEMCRTADRCDRLDAFLTGSDRTWLTLERYEDGPITVVVDKALAEARQQALTLKALVAELRASRGRTADPKREASPLGDLAKKRAARRRAAGL